jgi:hypothetical protein
MALTKVTNSMLVQPVNHNILINPSFTVKQRGDVVDHNEASYGPDRWKFRGVDGTKGTMSQSSTDSTTGINKLVVKHRNAESHTYTFQRIEAVNLLGLYGKEMTFSFSYSDKGGSGVPKVRIYSWDSSDNHKDLFDAVPTSLGDNRWTCTVTLSTMNGAIPDPSESGMEVYIYPNEKNTAPAEWSVWETKLEVGSVATPFIARPYSEELALCHRYYFRIGGVPNIKPVIGTGMAYNTNDCFVPVRFPVKMRSIPSMSYDKIPRSYIPSDSRPLSALTLGTAESTSQEVRLVGTDPSYFTAGNASWFQIDLGGTYVDFDAEL